MRKEARLLRPLLKTLALTFLLAALAGMGYAGWRSLAVTVRVATPAQYPYPPAAWAALAREMAREGGWLRFVRVPVADMTEAAKALSEQKADVAVLRSDLALPPEGKTVAVMRRDLIFLIAPASSKIGSFGDLKGQSVGVLPGPPGDEALLTGILKFFAVEPASVTRTPVAAADAGAAVRQKHIAAVLVVGRPGAGAVADAFASIARATKAEPKIVGVEEAEAVVDRIVTLEHAKIPAGAFGGPAPRPKEDVTTLSASWRLVAGPSLSGFTVGELTRQLFEAKGRLVTSDPLFADVEAPDADHSALPVHPAAKAYYDGDETSFLDSFESLVWIGWALIGVLGSAATWLVARLRFREREAKDLGRLIALFGDVRDADRTRLAELRAELHDAVSRMLAARKAGDVKDAEVVTYQIAITHVRQMIDDRAAALASDSPLASDSTLGPLAVGGGGFRAPAVRDAPAPPLPPSRRRG